MAKAHPELAVFEKIKPVSESRYVAQLGMSEDLLRKLKRIQDLESQRTKATSTLEHALERLADEYIERHDPIEKAKRFEEREKRKTSMKQVSEASNQPVLIQVPKESSQVKPKKYHALTAKLKHQVNLRYQGQCSHRDTHGERCKNKRWLETHHIQALELGGSHDLGNLTTLCSSHHRHLHNELKDSPF